MKSDIEQIIDFEKKRLATYKNLAGSPSRYKIKCRTDSRNGHKRYYIYNPDSDKEIYINQKNIEKLIKLQQKEFYSIIAKHIAHNILVYQSCLRKLLPDTESEVLNNMLKSYRPITNLISDAKFQQSENPIHPEGLSLVTSFGLYVRSKGELAIAELLYSLGIEFYYERRLTLISSKDGSKIHYYPDFTIVLADGSLFYWEHQGMLASKEYVQRNSEKLMEYYHNGIYEPHNLLITADGPNNALDMDGITRLVQALILPKAKIISY